LTPLKTGAKSVATPGRQARPMVTGGNETVSPRNRWKEVFVYYESINREITHQETACDLVEFRVFYGVLILGLVVNSEIDNLLCKRIPL
jgi:hypothetical protein